MKTLAVLIPWVLFFGCGQVKREAAPVSNPSSDLPVLATFNGEAITDEQIRQVAGAALTRAELELYEARKEGINQIVETRLLGTEAQKQGISTEDLLQREVQSKVKVTDADVAKFYRENQARFQGKKLEEVSGNVRGHLTREKSQEFHAKLMDRLKKKADLTINIRAPRIELAVGDSPSIGPEGAPVTLIEFTDYQCPFCGRVRPTITQILDTYKGKVRYALKDFPLSFHEFAFKAHEAGHCAGEQGKYWEMNKKLFGSQQSLRVDDLKKFAQEVGLNAGKFGECLDAGKFSERVRKGLDEGQAAGVSGTPAFFINGRMISGARPFEAFKDVIDDELASR